jgi:UDPglucose 6-dehydrogenase
LLPTAAAACAGADVLVVATEWPEFAQIDPATVAASMRQPWVIDQNGFLAKTMGQCRKLSYFRVGKAA